MTAAIPPSVTMPLCLASAAGKAPARAHAGAPTLAASVILAGAALLGAPAGQAAGPAAVFATNTDYATDIGPTALALGDVDGDGDLDLLTSNAMEGVQSVSVLLNSGDGTFQAKTDFATGPGPNSLALGDLNGDSTLDLVTCDRYSNPNTLSVLTGNGDGTFRPNVDIQVGGSGASVVLGDVVGDPGTMALDIVTANYRANAATVLLGNGDGRFQAPMDIPAAPGPEAAALGKVDGDATLDIVTVNYGYFNPGSVTVLLSNGDGTFRPPLDTPTGLAHRAVALGDVNGDNTLDIVTTSFRYTKYTYTPISAVSVLLGNGDGTFQARQDLPSGDRPYSLALGDVNGDDWLDIVIANEVGDYYTPNGTVSVLLGNGDGTFAARTEFATGRGPVAVALGDLDSDRKPDIATANGYDDTASALLNITPLALSFDRDTLHITPPPRSTVGLPSAYTIHYNTQARIDAGKPWAIWAKFWPSGVLGANLADAKTIADCQRLGAPTAVCYRPRPPGEQATGDTMVYRVFANILPGSVLPGWTPASPLLSVTR